MKRITDNTVGWLVVALVAVGLWGYSQYNQKVMLEWDIKTYRDRLSKYEGLSKIDSELRTLNDEFSQEQDFEDKTNRGR